LGVVFGWEFSSMYVSYISTLWLLFTVDFGFVRLFLMNLLAALHFWAF
jgi:hypothetical protein